jgi:hypothetical protein
MRGRGSRVFWVFFFWFCKSPWQQGEDWEEMWGQEGWMKRIDGLIVRGGVPWESEKPGLGVNQKLEKLVESRKIEEEESISLEWGRRQDS